MVEGEGMVMLSRRQYYPRYDREAPPLEVPEAGEHLWEWYLDLASKVRRISEGVCGAIPPTEFRAWLDLTGHIVYPWEYDILSAMDVAFCDEINKELEAKRASERDEMEQKGKRR